MAKYTTSICDILTNANTEGNSLKDLDNLYSLGSQYVFGESATNAVNEEYRKNFIIGFCLHYMFDEIGLETLPAFQIQLLDRLFNNKDFIDLMFDNLDKQIYSTYRTHIKDTRDQLDRSVSDDSATTSNETQTHNFTDAETRNLNDQTTYNITDAESGTDSTARTGTQSTSRGGYDSSTRTHTGTDTVASTGTETVAGSSSNSGNSSTSVKSDVTTVVDPTERDNQGNPINDGHRTRVVYGAMSGSSLISNTGPKTTFEDNLSYTEDTSGQNRSRTRSIDGSRTRSIGQLAELPQNGVSGGDVVPNLPQAGQSDVPNLIGYNASDNVGDSKYLSSAQVSDYQSVGYKTEGEGEAEEIGGATFEDYELHNGLWGENKVGQENKVIHTPGQYSSGSLVAGSNKQTNEQGGEYSTLESGKITTRVTGSDQDNVTEVDTSGNAQNSSTRTPNLTDTTTYNDSVTDRTDYNSNSTTTNNLIDSTTYGRQNRRTGTQTNAETGTDTVAHTGTGSVAGTGSIDRDISTDEDKQGHSEEKFIEMNYETLISATSLMDSVWKIFDNLFMQIF